VLAPGTTLARYVVEAPIGSGGMGAVYRARDTHLDRAVALKVLSDGTGGLPDQEARERLVREARAAAALSHPNAVAIYDAGDSEHGPFIVMELIEGETLRGAMGRGPSVASIVGWMKMAALALGDAHDRGIVHRDIKPENLMLRRDGIAKVLDFGIARQGSKLQDPSAPTHAALPTLTGTGVQVGTPQYMAPEQIKGKKLDGRTDQFAWAVTAYEALAGRLPWQADNGALGIVASILEEVPPHVNLVRTDVPSQVALAIARAMQKRPEDRFASMKDLVRALDGDADEAPDGSADTHVSVRPPAWSPAPIGAQLRPETRFSEGTVKAVIGKALAFDEQGGYSKSELYEAARELGISETALAEATHAIRVEKRRNVAVVAENEIRDRILRSRLRGFYAHLIPYIAINLIVIMPLLAQGAPLVAMLATPLSWGIGLAIHAMAALSKRIEPRQLRKEIQKEEEAIAEDAARRAALAGKLERRGGGRGDLHKGAAELGNAVQDGVASILAVAAQKIREGAGTLSPPAPPAPPPPVQPFQQAPRVRVEPPHSSVDDRLRAAAHVRAEAEADAEAAAASPPRRRVR